MKSSEKEFDAVDMKRRAAERIHDRLAEKDEAERKAYWQKRTEALRKRQSDLRGEASEDASSQ